MTFGIILLAGTVLFYLLSLISISDDSTLIETLRNFSTILGTTLAAIIAFYFGTRVTESAVEKTGRRLSKEAGLPDMTFPTIVQLDPPDRSLNVPIYSSINAKFSEPMQITTLTTSTFILRDRNNINVLGKVTSDGLTATFTPLQNLSYNSQYASYHYYWSN